MQKDFKCQVPTDSQYFCCVIALGCSNKHLEKCKPLTWMLNLEPILGQPYK